MGQPFNALDKHKVILGLSGGVDSTAAALLLQEKGYRVTGLYFDVNEESGEGRQAAEEAARQLHIPFIYRNVHSLFQSEVVKKFCEDYLSGRTPNPCVYCNPAVKFKILTEEADKAGAFHIATGHYAQTGYHQSLGWSIKRSDSRKDQSYMLYRLPSSVIRRLILPLARLQSKEESRAVARKHDMFNAEKKDSQEICFIPPEESCGDFICRKGYSMKEGDFINRDGETLGRHKGLAHYTVGQRKGLGVTFGKPVFVTKMDPERNTVTLGDEDELFSREVICGNGFFPVTESGCLPEFLEGTRVLAKVRYAAKPAPAVIKTRPDGKIQALFQDRQRAATPGQSIVFYLDGFVIGGGFIE